MSKLTGRIMVAFAIWCLVIAVSFVLINLASGKIFNKPANGKNRQASRAEIHDRNDSVLAYGPSDDRHYPSGPIASHFTGFVHPDIGTGGIIEMNYADRLVSNKMAKLMYFKRNENLENSSITTTLDLKLQKALYESLGDRGAITVINAATGEVLAMISKPSFDPNSVTKDWDRLNSMQGEDAPLFNKALRGKFPPGSVMKVIDALAFVDETEKPVLCKGAVTVSGKTIKCSHIHGRMTLREAFAKSCNVYFITRAMQEVKSSEFSNILSKFASKKVPDKMSKWNYALSVVGQGPALMSPAEGALLAASVINAGKRPGLTYIKGEKARSDTVMSARHAMILRDYMTEVVKTGTARQLHRFLKSGSVGVKTGTAQIQLKNGSLKNIAWMIGFAQADGDPIAFAVVVENTDSFASESCSPIVAKILVYCFDRNKGK